MARLQVRVSAQDCPNVDKAWPCFPACKILAFGWSTTGPVFSTAFGTAGSFAPAPARHGPLPRPGSALPLATLLPQRRFRTAFSTCTFLLAVDLHTAMSSILPLAWPSHLPNGGIAQRWLQPGVRPHGSQPAAPPQFSFPDGPRAVAPSKYLLLMPS